VQQDIGQTGIQARLGQGSVQSEIVESNFTALPQIAITSLSIPVSLNHFLTRNQLIRINTVINEKNAACNPCCHNS
jgi:hypothetical protein